MSGLGGTVVEDGKEKRIMGKKARRVEGRQPMVLQPVRVRSLEAAFRRFFKDLVPRAPLEKWMMWMCF